MQKKRLTSTEIHAGTVDTLRDDATGLLTGQKWAAEFKKEQNRTLEDDPRSGRPATATTPEIIDRVHQIVMDDRPITITHMAKEVGISRERLETILLKELGMSNGKKFKSFVLGDNEVSNYRIRVRGENGGGQIF